MRKAVIILVMIAVIVAGWKHAGKVPVEREKKLKAALELASEYETKGYYKDAILVYEKALKIEDSTDVKRKIIMDYLAMGDGKNFKREAEKYVKQNPDEEIYKELIEGYLDGNDKTNASKMLANAEKAFPESEVIAELRNRMDGQYSLSYTDYTELSEFIGGYMIAEAPQNTGATETDATETATVLLKGNGKYAVMNTFDEIYDVKDDDDSSGILDEVNIAEEVVASGVIEGETDIASLDEDGNRRAIESEGYDYLGVVHEGRILAEKDGKWGYIYIENENGNKDEYESLGFIYEDATAYDNGVAAVKKNGKWALIDKNEKAITDYKYDDVYMDCFKNVSRGGAVFVKTSGSSEYTLIDFKGKELTGDRYEEVKGFLGDDGVAAVKKNGKWGAVNKKGEAVLKCEYDELGASATAYIPYKDGDKWGYISPSGSVMIEPQFDDIRAVSTDGYGAVKDRGTWEFITIYSIRGDESIFD